MQTFAIYIDRVLPLPELTQAMTGVLAIPSDDVRAINQDEFERRPWHWFGDDVAVGMQVATIRGDFPQEVTVVSRLAMDIPQTVGALAHVLQATVLTDNFGVNPLVVSAWTMVFPSGEVQSVYTDAEAFSADDPSLILLPEFRKDYDNRHQSAFG